MVTRVRKLKLSIHKVSPIGGLFTLCSYYSIIAIGVIAMNNFTKCTENILPLTVFNTNFNVYIYIYI